MKKVNIYFEVKFNIDVPEEYTLQQIENAAKKQVIKAIKEGIYKIGINE